MAAIGKQLRLGRYQTPEDTAYAVVFLAGMELGHACQQIARAGKSLQGVLLNPGYLIRPFRVNGKCAEKDRHQENSDRNRAAQWR